MSVIQFFYGWFYYGIYYMMASAFVTLMLNRVTKRLWLSPLIINAVSVVILLTAAALGWIASENATYAMYFNYMPIVFASVLTNTLVWFGRKLGQWIDENLWGFVESPGRGKKK
jgi:hypothetical protein